jgi:hypothetical protein
MTTQSISMMFLTRHSAIFYRLGRITPLGVFSDANTGPNMRVHLVPPIKGYRKSHFTAPLNVDLPPQGFKPDPLFAFGLTAKLSPKA